MNYPHHRRTSENYSIYDDMPDTRRGFACELTHWGRVTHICVSKLTIIGSDTGLSPGRRQAIIWTKGGILLIWLLRIKFSDILIEINTFSFKKMHLKLSSAKRRPFRLGLNELIVLRLYRSWMKTDMKVETKTTLRFMKYRKVYNIKRTKSQNLNASRLIL